MTDPGSPLDGFDPMGEFSANTRFLLDRAAHHRRRLDTLRELLLTEAHYGTGATASDVIYEEGSMRVLRLVDAVGAPFTGPPVVLVPAPVSRYFILDLLPDRSFARHLGDAGFDTFIIDFGEPASEDRFADLEWYVDGLMHRAVREIRRLTSVQTIGLIGYCLGGTFALLYAALYPGDVNRLTLLTTLVDTQVRGGIAWMATHLGVDGESFDHPRIVPASTIKSWFEALAPGSNSQEGRRADMLAQLDLSLDKLKTIRTMATWVDDIVPTSGRLLAEISAKFGPDANEIMSGRSTVGSREVDISSITMPVLAVSADRDHIAPADGCDAVVRVIPHAEVVRLPGGHVGAVAGSRAADLWQIVADFHSSTARGANAS